MRVNLDLGESKRFKTKTFKFKNTPKKALFEEICVIDSSLFATYKSFIVWSAIHFPKVKLPLREDIIIKRRGQKNANS